MRSSWIISKVATALGLSGTACDQLQNRFVRFIFKLMLCWSVADPGGEKKEGALSLLEAEISLLLSRARASKLE